MNIAVDATCWQNQRGYGRHARALLRTLVKLDDQNRYTFFIDSPTYTEKLPPEAGVRIVSAGTPAAIAAAADGNRSLRDMGRMSRALSSPSYDIVVFPTVYSYVPVFGRAKKVVFIHDVIAEKFPQLTLPRRSARLFWQLKVGLALKQADAIVTVSEFSRRMIAGHFKMNPARINVVGEASDPVFRRLPQPALTPCLAACGIPETGRLIAYVGGFGPHKNLDTLVSVFARLVGRQQFDDLRLVMVGEYQNEVFYSGYQSLSQQIEDLGIRERVIFTGYLPDEEVVVLLNRSAVLALPSLMEGFGLPAVEAAACGCPVVATSSSPLPELLGEGGIYIRPEHPEELEQALARVLQSESLRQQMSRAGSATAQALTWEKAAHQLLDVFRRAKQP